MQRHLWLGSLGAFGVVDLPTDLEVLETPPVLITASVLYALEFFADKIPGIDSLNDTLHTFIRIPAGALLAMGSVSDVAESWQVVAALLLGGVVSAGTHAAKMGSRAIINTSPEPFSNWFASIFEDVIVVIGLLLAVVQSHGVPHLDGDVWVIPDVGAAKTVAWPQDVVATYPGVSGRS